MKDGRKKTALRIRATRKRFKETSIELAGHEGLLKLAMEDMRKMYEDLLQAQSQAQQADKLAAIGLLAAGIIHEINNPLTVVQGTVSILAQHVEVLGQVTRAMEKVKKAVRKNRDMAAAESALRELESIEEKLRFAYVSGAIPGLVASSLKGLEHTVRITRALKSFSRSDRGEIAPVNLNRVLDDVVEIVWNQIKCRAKPQKEYGKIPPVACNAQQISQVFMNLLINASHAIARDGVITIRTSADGARVYAEVRDTGTGIPPEVLPRIFEPFFTTKDADKGTGLGLSICMDIVKKHKGEIKVKSEPGKGTAFTVCLPFGNGK